MKKESRKAVIAGNWKMNKTPAEAKALIEEMKPLVADADCEVVLCVPYVDIPAAVEAAAGSNIRIGAENVHFKASGAYTGEVSAEMLKAVGVEYVIIGHSERRQYFGETDQTVNLRTLAALNAGLKTIVCVGETLEQRELGYTEALLKYQTKIALTNVTAEQLKNVVIAYEPVWAIGTGVTATADQADEGNGFVRAAVAEAYGADAAEAVTVQYGGSMNAKNADELVSKINVDGGLIGGASLKAADFSVIVKAASK
ncbi:MAG: triose-phosphate isomerase [Clostridia bacterium]|nr:triose-phosphate isomerase [Clostridia bacterium]